VASTIEGEVLFLAIQPQLLITIVKIQTIDSGGLWGIESDSDSSYLNEIGKEQVEEVREYLRTLCVQGIDNCEIVTN